MSDRKGNPEAAEKVRDGGGADSGRSENIQVDIQVEITDAQEFHCFRLVFNPKSTSACCNAPLNIWASGDTYCRQCGQPCGAEQTRIEIMLHARSLVDLIHKLSLALCDWQAQTSAHLIEVLTEYARRRGLK